MQFGLAGGAVEKIKRWNFPTNDWTCAIFISSLLIYRIALNIKIEFFV